jgi:hypothetical protein
VNKIWITIATDFRVKRVALAVNNLCRREWEHVKQNSVKAACPVMQGKQFSNPNPSSTNWHVVCKLRMGARARTTDLAASRI